MKKLSRLKIAAVVISVLAVAFLALLYFVFHAEVLIPASVTLFFVLLLLVMFYYL